MFQNKKILITHIWLRGFGGAEINILELASFFKDNGAEVEVFTFFVKDPMKTEFEQRNIPVITDNFYPFDLTSYDYIWSAQNILPITIIKNLGQKRVKTPKFLFFHMAALPEHVLEQPFVYQLEEKISSTTLAVSQEIVDDNLHRFFGEIPNLQFYQNPVPPNYIQEKYRHTHSNLKKILVISNHPPQEIKELEDELKEFQVEVDYYGVWTDKYELVSPDLLTKYDCVIGIGKNIPYCLVMGKPIYVYDHFAGPGFLTDENFEIAEYHNFSGRGFETQKRTSKEIAEDILKHFSEAKEFQEKNLEKFQKQFSLQYVVPSILQNIEDNGEIDIVFDSYYITYLLAMNIFIKDIVVRLDNDTVNLWNQVYYLEDELGITKDFLRSRTDELDIVTDKYRAIEKELALLKASRFYTLSLKWKKVKKIMKCMNFSIKDKETNKHE
ncbi:glycosyltransferase [Streptococcus pneumoniae]